VNFGFNLGQLKIISIDALIINFNTIMVNSTVMAALN